MTNSDTEELNQQTAEQEQERVRLEQERINQEQERVRLEQEQLKKQQEKPKESQEELPRAPSNPQEPPKLESPLSTPQEPKQELPLGTQANPNPNSDPNSDPSPTQTKTIQDILDKDRKEQADLARRDNLYNKIVELKKRNKEYIDRIERNKVKVAGENGEDSFKIDFKHNFLFFPNAQASNRETNYCLAKHYDSKLNDIINNETATYNDLVQLLGDVFNDPEGRRKEIADDNNLHPTKTGIWSFELRGVIRDAQSAAEKGGYTAPAPSTQKMVGPI